MSAREAPSAASGSESEVAASQAAVIKGGTSRGWLVLSVGDVMRQGYLDGHSFVKLLLTVSADGPLSRPDREHRTEAPNTKMR
jgi:hypothetical protein